MTPPPDLPCPICGKIISDEEYVVNWASCSDCYSKHVNAYFEANPHGFPDGT